MVKQLIFIGVVVLIGLTFSAVSFAVVGETEAQLTKRFGKPTEVLDEKDAIAPAEKLIFFEPAGQRVGVSLLGGRSAAEHFTFDTNISGPNDERVKAVLDAHAGNGAEWMFFDEQKCKQMFQRQNLRLMWILTAGQGISAAVRLENPRKLEVQSKAFTDLLQ